MAMTRARADRRPVRRRRRAHPGGRGGARRLRRGVQAQRDRLRRHPADFGDHGAVRRRRRLFAGDDRFHLHGARHQLHVRHRAGRGEDGDQRDRHRRGTRRRLACTRPNPRSPTAPTTTTSNACCRCAGCSTSCRRTTPPARRNGRRSTTIDREEPSLDTLVPDNPNKPYDIKELILKVADEGDFFEISATFARNIVTGFGRIAGRTVGFVANQPMVLAGVLDTDATRKAARFVRFCDCLQHSDRHLRRRARLPARHRAGIWRPDQARRQAAVRLFARRRCRSSP